MNLKEELLALLRIQKQLNEYAAFYPEHRVKLHGCGELKECLQLMKTIINKAEERCLKEEWDLQETNLNNMYPEL